MKDNPHHESSDLFVGARLAARRQKAGIPIEKAAKDTRIPVSRLRAIESDDFSSFAHPTYARMFLNDYANYLGVPHEEIRDHLPGGKNPENKLGTTENTYLDVLLTKPGFLEGDQFKSIRRLLVAVAILIGLLLLVGAGIYGWRFWKKFERVKPTTPPAAAVPTPTPKPSPALILPPANSTPTPRGDSFTVMPKPSPTATPQASSTPLTSLPPFEPAPRPKRPQ